MERRAIDSIELLSLYLPRASRAVLSNIFLDDPCPQGRARHIPLRLLPLALVAHWVQLSVPRLADLHRVWPGHALFHTFRYHNGRRRRRKTLIIIQKRVFVIFTTINTVIRTLELPAAGGGPPGLRNPVDIDVANVGKGVR